jgi:esterase/lipase superfamily enzyme
VRRSQNCRSKNNTPSGKSSNGRLQFRGYHAANFAFRHPGYVSHLFLWVVHSISKAFSMVFTMMMYFIVLLIFLYGLEDHELWNIDIV